MTEQIRERILGEHSGPDSIYWPQRSGATSEQRRGIWLLLQTFSQPVSHGLRRPDKIQNQKLTKVCGQHPYTQFAQYAQYFLHVISINRRHNVLTLGNFFGRKVFDNVSMAVLREKFMQEYVAVIKLLVLFSAQKPGTKDFLSQEAKKAVAVSA